MRQEFSFSHKRYKNIGMTFSHLERHTSPKVYIHKERVNNRASPPHPSGSHPFIIQASPKNPPSPADPCTLTLHDMTHSAQLLTVFLSFPFLPKMFCLFVLFASFYLVLFCLSTPYIKPLWVSRKARYKFILLLLILLIVLTLSLCLENAILFFYCWLEFFFFNSIPFNPEVTNSLAHSCLFTHSAVTKQL